MTEPIPSSNLPLTEVNAIETVNVSLSVRRSTRQRRPVHRDKMPTVERSTELTLPFIDFTSNAMQSPQSPRTPKRRKLNSAEPQSSPKTPASKRKRWKEPPPLYVQLRRYNAWLQVHDFSIARTWRHCLFPLHLYFPWPHRVMKIISNYLPDIRTRLLLAATCQTWRHLLFKQIGLNPDVHPDRNTYGARGVKLLQNHARTHSNVPNQ
jgi:hypothetical protein